MFKTDECKGWLSKTFLNYYGIDTVKESKEIYINRTVPDVIEELYINSNISHIRVAKLLINIYKFYIINQ